MPNPPRSVVILHAARNSRLPCSVRRCRYRRHFTSQWCSQHRTNASQYGHPEARHLLKREWAPHLRTVRAFFRRQSGHPALVTGEEILRVLLNPGQEPRQLNHCDARYLLWRELARLQGGRNPLRKVTPREALETVTAVYLLIQREPQLLPDDGECLSRALAHAVLRLRPITGLYVYDHVKGKPQKFRARPPGALVVADLGQRLRTSLAPFFVNISAALSK